jgi:aspartyl/asparaginyl beta-hydroxylase (cupin superfamily)
MISILKFPFNFDAEKLKSDLSNFASEDWTPHFNTQYYEGDWSGIALRAAKDANVQLYPDPMAAAYENTEMLARCAYVPEVLSAFECEIEAARFLRLAAGSNIIEHRDYKLGFEDGFARVHVPMQTNNDVEFYLGGVSLQMNEGEAWYLNFNLPHSVKNGGTEDRIHLVIDCILNDWLREFFPKE